MKLVFILFVLQSTLLINGVSSGDWAMYCPQCGVAGIDQSCCCFEKVGESIKCDSVRQPRKDDKGFCCDY